MKNQTHILSHAGLSPVPIILILKKFKVKQFSVTGFGINTEDTLIKITHTGRNKVEKALLSLRNSVEQFNKEFKDDLFKGKKYFTALTPEEVEKITKKKKS